MAGRKVKARERPRKGIKRGRGEKSKKAYLAGKKRAVQKVESDLKQWGIIF